MKDVMNDEHRAINKLTLLLTGCPLKLDQTVSKECESHELQVIALWRTT
jgi:hypothetical protein